MGLTATQRFANQTVTNDGNGTFTAHRGFDTSAGSPYATWNFDYYLSEVVPTGQTTPTYFYRTFIDINPAVGNSIGEYIDITPTAPLPGAFPNAAGTYVVQDSFNLGQLFGAGAGTVAGGQYGLVIQAYDSEGFIMPENAVSILVNIDTPAVVPEPGSLALIGLGLAGLAVARKRKAK